MIKKEKKIKNNMPTKKCPSNIKKIKMKH